LGLNNIIEAKHEQITTQETPQNVLEAYQIKKGLIETEKDLKKRARYEKELVRVINAAEKAMSKRAYQRSSELLELGARIALKLGNEEKATEYLARADAMTRSAV
jgi:hypothetical protein